MFGSPPEQYYLAKHQSRFIWFELGFSASGSRGRLAGESRDTRPITGAGTIARKSRPSATSASRALHWDVLHLRFSTGFGISPESWRAVNRPLQQNHKTCRLFGIL